jgi:hypothetical protein
MLKVKKNGESLGFRAFEMLENRISHLGSENQLTTVICHTRIESHQHVQTIIFEVVHIGDILINKAIYFNFENMTALSNAENPKF